MTSNDNIAAPVALERDIRQGALVRSRLLGKDLVLWRGESGGIHVWHDNCPHRSVRLSAGRNLGNCLEAIYHGWRFGEDATVISVPAEGGKARPELSAEVLVTEVSEGFVWASLGDEIETDPNLAGNPARPIFIRRPAAQLRRALPRIAGTYLTVSPWDDSSSVMYGAVDGDSQTTLRAINTNLVTFQRQIERGET